MARISGGAAGGSSILAESAENLVVSGQRGAIIYGCVGRSACEAVWSARALESLMRQVVLIRAD
jgi:hypothetical protein